MQPSKRKRINTGWCGFDSHTSYQENKNPGGKRKVKGCDKVIINIPPKALIFSDFCCTFACNKLILSFINKTNL